ncbi:MAG: transposase [Chloroflexota bacterium]
MTASIRLLIINKQLSFSLRIKRTLEVLGNYEVVPFTTLETAAEYLRQRAQHVALIDFTLPGISGLDIVLRIRSIQPDIRIIASPDLPEVTAVVNQMNLDGMVDTPCGARDLLPVIHKVLQQTVDNLPDTAEVSSIGSDSETLPIPPPESLPEYESLDSVLIRAGYRETESQAVSPGGDQTDEVERQVRTIEFVLKADTPTDEIPLPDGVDEQSVRVFRRLAAEEPPMPTLEEIGTIRDLHMLVGDADLEKLAQAMEDPRLMPPMLPSGENEIQVNSLARAALQAAADTSLSLNDLSSSIQYQFPDTQGLKPLPSWVSHLKRYVDEPDFLSEVDSSEILPGFEGPDTASVQTTHMTDPEALTGRPGDMETDRLFAQDLRQGEWPEDSPKVMDKPSAELPPYEFDSVEEDVRKDAYEVDSGDLTVEESLLPVPQPPRNLPGVLEEGQQIITHADGEDPRLMQMAVSLTQMSLELTAEATLLARQGEILAYAGTLPVEEVESLREVFADDWEAIPGESRIRFITLASSGKDYMIHSRRTAEGFTLSMIFPGNMPLRVIRSQSDKLLRALQSVPDELENETSLLDELTERELHQLEAMAAREVEAALESSNEVGVDSPNPLLTAGPLDLPDFASPDYSGPLTGYTFLWVINDPDDALPSYVMQAIRWELDRQLADMGWQVENLQVYEDYIYLMADVPGDISSHQIIADLKQRSAWISHAVENAIDPETLWSDGYCVLTPGREMEVEEIQRYINFAHMR